MSNNNTNYTVLFAY